jgi:hypothetical protein
MCEGKGEKEGRKEDKRARGQKRTGQDRTG